MKHFLARLGSFLVIVAALLGLGFIGKLIYGHINLQGSPANVLPSSQVALYLELNTDNESIQKWDTLFAAYPGWQFSALQKKLLTLIGISELGSDIDFTLQRGALVWTTDRQLLLLVADFPEDLLQQMEAKWSATWVNDIVVVETRALAWTERGNFTIFARQADSLRQISEGKNRLGSDTNFIQIRDGLPKGIFLTYFNGSNLLTQEATSLPESNLEEQSLWQPLANLFQEGGMSLQLEGGGLLLRSKTVYDDGIKEMATRIFSRVKTARHDLTDLFPRDILAYYESADLRSDWIDLENILRQGAPVINELWQRRKAYWEEGTSLSLSEDILKLADGPYALAITEKNNDSNSEERSLALMGVFQNDRTFLQEKMTYFEDLLLQKIPAMYPEVDEIQLADGTTTEAMRVGEKPTREELEIDGVKIIALEFSELPWDLIYAIDDDYLLLATDRQTLINMIIARNQDNGLLSDRDDFQDSLKKVNGMRADLIFVDLGKIKKWIPAKLQGLVQPFSIITGGKNLLDFESLAAWYLGVR